MSKFNPDNKYNVAKSWMSTNKYSALEHKLN